MKLFICEKPGVAMDIAKMLGGVKRDTYWETDVGRFTWCFGHLLSLDKPEEYEPSKYGSPWRWDVLPIVPQPFRLSAAQGKSAQLKAIGKLLKECSGVVIATDAEREGEMIGREVLVHFKYSGPVERLWLSALDPDSVGKAMRSLRPGSETINFYHAGKARSEADWLIGMNLTRAMTLKSPRGSGVVSVGRVQTPTVALVVRRDREIANFVALDYFELRATVAAGADTLDLRYSPTPRVTDRKAIEELQTKSLQQSGPLKITMERKNTSPPKLFSLSGLQKRADAIWGWPAKKTLLIAQSLYEKHKATTYPRTNCEYLPEEQMVDADIISRNLLGLSTFEHLRGLELKARKGSFNTAKVSAHHAIIPTKISPPLDDMSNDEQKAYLLIAAHYLSALMPDFVYESTTITLAIVGVEFKATGTVPISEGWRVALRAYRNWEDEEDAASRLPKIPAGTVVEVRSCEVDAKKTKAPSRYTEGTLIADMENVSKYVEDAAKRAVLDSEENNKQRGIGTEATRADIIANVRDREFIIPFKGRQLQASPKAHAFIEFIEGEIPALADPGETAVWEEALESVAAGRRDSDSVVAEIARKVGDYLKILERRPAPEAAPLPQGKSTGVFIPGFGEGQGDVELIDHGDTFKAEGWPGKFFSEIAKRRISPGEYRLLVCDWRGEKRGVRLAGFKSRAGKSFATTLHFDGSARPYPAVRMSFEN